MPQDWYVITSSGTEVPLRFWLLLRRVSMAPDTLVRKGTLGKWKCAHEYKELRPFLTWRKKKPEKSLEKKPDREEDPKPRLPPSQEPDLSSHLDSILSDVIVTCNKPPLLGQPWWIWLLILFSLALSRFIEWGGK